jgi:putative addiction module component (TIGR02574 family)
MPSLPIAQFAQLRHTLGMGPSDADIAALTIDQRLELIERLWASMPEDDVAPLDPAFEAEVAKRLSEARRSPDTLLDGAAVIAQLRASLR